MDVSVIVVNYNTKFLTLKCVNSIFYYTKGVEFEIILVDNGSTDGSYELFSADNRITYIYSKENLGFGRANNLGYQSAKGDYLFLLNSDAYLQNNAIYILWKRMIEQIKMNGEQVACAGCMLSDADGNVIHSYAKFPTKLHSFLCTTFYPVLLKLRILDEMPNTSNYNSEILSASVFDVDYVTGADIMVKRNVADKYGLFDPDFFMYSEETEMQHRYMKVGYRRIICKGPRIVHLEGGSNRQMSPYRTTIVMRSMLLYFKKTSRPVDYVLFLIILKICHFFVYLLSFPFLNGDLKGKMLHLWETIKM